MRIVKVEEAAPETRPQLSLADAEVIWSRFEVWCSYRWGVRDVTWTVEGAGEFVPPLRPATFTSAKLWTPGNWHDQTPDDGPLGLILRGGTWRLTYEVGDEGVADDVAEAARRYSEYLQQTAGEAGITSLKDGDYAITRNANAVARALQYSGAADLLRAYR